MKTAMQSRKATLAALIALCLSATPMAWAQVASDSAESGTKVVPIEDARLKIELNATDRDAGIQVFIDADPWRSMSIYDPHGKPIFKAFARGRFGRQGGTELFMESAEPTLRQLPLNQFLKRFPEGNYRIVGRGLDGEKMVGIARFTHDIPQGPELVAPLKGTVVDPNGPVVVNWRSVPPANGSPIIGYQVLVVKPDTGIRALPKITLDVMMPPTATSLLVPPGFLLPDSEYEWEVLAIERGGNQTLSSSAFRTSP